MIQSNDSLTTSVPEPLCINKIFINFSCNGNSNKMSLNSKLRLKTHQLTEC